MEQGHEPLPPHPVIPVLNNEHYTNYPLGHILNPIIIVDELPLEHYPNT